MRLTFSTVSFSNFNLRVFALAALTTLPLTLSSAAFAKTMDVGAFMPETSSNQPLEEKKLAFANPKPFEYGVLLPALSDHERKQMETTIVRGPHKFGIHREVPFLQSEDLSSKLTWRPINDGVVAYLNVRSLNAQSIRYAADLEIPQGATVSFYSTDEQGKSKVIYSFTTTDKAFNENRYWSPQADGERIGMEIRLSDPEDSKHLKLELVTVAHRYDVLAMDAPMALECSNHKEIQCAIDDGDISEGNAKTTLRLIFESDGGSYTCSGTLMNVSGDGEDVFIPYVITAAHCISTSDEANSVQAWWSYQTSSCSGGATSSEFTRTYGGADLLASLESHDQTLIRLNEDPPAGSYFSGWWATDIGVGIDADGAHHPDGGVKKYFAGTTTGSYNINLCDEDDNCTLVYDTSEVEMYDGTAEGGSSGAGMRIYNQEYDDDLFVGVLAGSDSECTNSKVYFGKFTNFYPSVSTWFDPEEPPPGDEGDDDHGNDPTTATSIFIVSETEGEIENADDVDYFSVEVDREGTITVYTSGSLDTVGTLSSETGEVEIESDDDGEGYNFSISADVEPGVYYIRVEGWGGSTGEYTLHVEFESDDDHGNFWNTATTLSSRAQNWEFSTVGHLEVAEDIDAFELTLYYDSAITVYTEGSTDTKGRLTSEAGIELFKNEDINEDDSNFSISGSVDDGTYYLFVEGTVTEKSEYTLIFEIDPPVDVDQ